VVSSSSSSLAGSEEEYIAAVAVDIIETPVILFSS